VVDQESYNVSEDQGTILVCVRITAGADPGRDLRVTVETAPNTATGKGLVNALWSSMAELRIEN
jgi:hypothetical protein